jgi:acetyltransferase-like isoleucine patch superfamily enzyme
VVLIAAGVVLAWCCAGGIFVLYRIGLVSFLTGSRLLALVPGAFGICLRRCWYQWTLSACGNGLVVDWLGTFKTPTARVGSRVFIGSMCWIAEVDIRDDVMIAARGAIQGGARTHGTEEFGIPMNQQPGQLRTVVLGPDVWIGTGATVMADVAPGTIVAAGAVVTRTFPELSVLAGVPARVIRRRADPGTVASDA